MIPFSQTPTHEDALSIISLLQEKINAAAWNNPIQLTCLGIWNGMQKEASLFLSVLESQAHKRVIPAEIAFLPEETYSLRVLPLLSSPLDRSDAFQMTDETRFMKTISDLFYKKFLLSQDMPIEELKSDASLQFFNELVRPVVNGEVTSNGIWCFAEQT